MGQTTRSYSAGRVLTCLLPLALWLGHARAQQLLTVAAFPAVDEIVRGAIPRWNRLHPNVGIKVVSRQFSDHHTAMTTALSTSKACSARAARSWKASSPR